MFSENAKYLKHLLQKKQLVAPSIHMEVLYAAPKYRRRRIGKQLMGALAKVPERDRCAAIDWECYAWNSGSMAFYKRGGAVDVTADTQTHYMMLQQSYIDKMAE